MKGPVNGAERAFSFIQEKKKMNGNLATSCVYHNVHITSVQKLNVQYVTLNGLRFHCVYLH